MKAALMVGNGNYQDVEQSLLMYVGAFDFQREVTPKDAAGFGQDWALYVLDTDGMNPMNELEAVQDAAKLVRSFPNRRVVLWSERTWDRMKTVADDAAYASNCLRCDIPGWVDKLVLNIKRMRRLRRDQN